MPERVLFAWSGGKDSTMALYELLNSQNYEIAALLSTVTRDYDRISMHGVRTLLIERQAKALGFPLEKIYISKDSSNEEYEASMKETLGRYYNLGVSSVAFGDIFLEDLRKYREQNLAKAGIKGIFPVWKRDSSELARAFIDSGFKAIVTCIDSEFLGKDFVGKVFDRQFLSELPGNVDPCGENGEFHSFVYDGPIFSEKVEFEKGEIVLRDERFYYCDLLPTDKPSCNLAFKY